MVSDMVIFAYGSQAFQEFSEIVKQQQIHIDELKHQITSFFLVSSFFHYKAYIAKLLVKTWYYIFFQIFAVFSNL